MRVIKHLQAACCTIILTSLLAITGNAQEGPVIDGRPDNPILANCDLKRSSTGAFSLHITGSNFREGAIMTVNGVRPKKLKFKDPSNDVPIYTRIIAKGRLCDLLPGAVVVSNPGGDMSPPLQCNQRCGN